MRTSAARGIEAGRCLRKAAPLAVIAAAALVATLPLFLSGSLPFSHDIAFHVFLAEQFQQNLAAGSWFPRWARDAVSGYGSPIFVFYAPLSYWLAALLGKFAAPVGAVGAAIWLSYFFSGGAMYLLGCHLHPPRLALVAGVIYIFLPFHLADLYGRGSFASLFAYCWFPLILLFLLRLRESRSPRLDFAGLALSYAGLILTHLPSAFMFSVILGFVSLRLALTGSRSSLLRIVPALVCGVGISAVYLLPALLERGLVHIDYLNSSPLWNYAGNFLFTFSSPDRSEFTVFLHLAVLADVILVLVLLGRWRRGRSPVPGERLGLLVFLAALVLTLPLSRPLVTLFPALSVLQFPWRWLALIDFGAAYLVAALVPRRGEGTGRGELVVAAVVAAVVLVGGSAIVKSVPISPAGVRLLNDPAELKRIMDPVVEYIPRQVREYRHLSPEPVALVAGRGTVQPQRWDPEERVVAAALPAPAKVRFATFAYPGWRLELDGRPVPTETEEGTGAIVAEIPAGEHLLRLRFLETPDRRCGGLVSLLFLLVFLPAGMQLSAMAAVVPPRPVVEGAPGR